MSEKSKMLKEELYTALDTTLVNETNTAKDLCFEYNNIKPSKYQ